MKLFFTILQLICGLLVITVVLMQSGKSAGLSGAIGGVADSFLSRNKARTWDAKLALDKMDWRGVPDSHAHSADYRLTAARSVPVPAFGGGERF